MRPEQLESFLGQSHLLDQGKPLRETIERGTVGSMVFWGPPGSGKTTLARLVANYTDRAFVLFSAVTEGVPRVREIIKEAKQRQDVEGRGTILFCDEIHRFNKAQQDAFLPWVEEGVITLIGATTENPSFELNSALLSRLRVFVLEPLPPKHIASIVENAWNTLNDDRPNASVKPELGDDALDLLVRHADGDARRALNATEAVREHVTALDEQAPESISADLIEAVLERRLARYDKSGEEHFNLISALHKAVRGSDVEGALYWLARMIEGGEDPMYLSRRVVRMASEDIGLADPRALQLALSAKDAYHFLGSPEGELALVEAVVFLATAPKSNRIYKAWSSAQQAAREHPAATVPKHIRNAPTRLMKEHGYGEGYRYDHAEGGHAAGQEYLPDALRGASWYEPTNQGFEKIIAERIAWWRDRKEQ
ncbi:MAG: replication-associated recombination protein A [Candidatus Rariloculaceae bacterium]